MDTRAFRRHLRGAFRALSAQPQSPCAHVHPSYTEEELLRRADEFNAKAEQHWRKIAAEPDAREHVLNKPLSTVRDTAGILYRLGLVLQELDLGIGMTVVDFGSGSCWLSSFMNRLRCRTISIDVSPTALELGKEMFRSDPRHHLEAKPQFLVYEGHGIALPDASADRIVCFDSFHHVPNQAEVLREFYRILKPGGRLVMGEPGEGHAHSDQGAYETEIHGVLENDLHLDDLAALAQSIGFETPRLKPFGDPGGMTFSLEQHVRFMAGEDDVFPLAALRESLRHFMVLSLLKGSSAPDSRNPSVLRAEITALDLSSNPSGNGTTLKVRVKNTGDTKWLHEQTPLGGFVALGAHASKEGGDFISRGFTRLHLSRSVDPGESVDLEIRLPRLHPEGDVRVQLDMVDERVAWFEQCGSAPLLLKERFEDAISPAPDGEFASLALKAPAAGRLEGVAPGAPIEVTLEIANKGSAVWTAGAPGLRGAICLGVELCDRDGVLLNRDYERFALPANLGPGETIDFALSCHAPADPGVYRLRFDLVNEGIAWFEHYGLRPIDLVIAVGPKPL